MVGFLVYDIIFLILFSLAVTLFLIKHKKQLSREGIVFMYRTQVGVKAIKWVGDNFQKTLHSLKYVIIGMGILLMAGILWMLGQTLSLYVLHPEITRLIKAPPIAPLIPYFPKLFGMQSFFPPFYFTYFIVALAIVAVVHEFSHGIYMRLFKIKIKSTGLVFLGPILGAFVEEEKRNFEKKKKSEQMTVLGAGVFANIVFALIFYLIYIAFFHFSFAPSGYIFNTYGLAVIPTSNITSIQYGENLTKVLAGNQTYYLDKTLSRQLNITGLDKIVAYPDAPAVRAGLKGAIVQVDGTKIRNKEDLKKFLETKKPGDEITIKTIKDKKEREYRLILSHHPEDKNKPYIGVGFSYPASKGIIRKFINLLMFFKEPSTYYAPKFHAELIYFIFYMLWWIMVINLLVALFNMMPVGMLDGGRFFYLLILSLTGSKKFSKKAFQFSNYVIFLVFLLLMFFWFIRVF